MILTGDCRDLLQTLPDNSIDCCITSPPYWGLRDYGMDGQIGLESTLEEYIDQLTQISSEIFRILKPTGTYWLNLGDKYVKSSPGGKGDPTIGQKPIPAKIPAPRKTDYPDKCLLLIPSSGHLPNLVRVDPKKRDRVGKIQPYPFISFRSMHIISRESIPPRQTAKRISFRSGRDQRTSFYK